MTKRYTRARRWRGTAVRALTSGVCGLVMVAMSTVPAQADHALLPGTAGGRPAKVVEENSPTPAPSQCTADKPTLVPQRPPALDQLGIEEAWKISRGSKVIVAVVDSGVDGNNVHFKNKNVLLPGYDMMDGGDGSIDVAMHGTALAGLLSVKHTDPYPTGEKCHLELLSRRIPKGGEPTGVVSCAVHPANADGTRPGLRESPDSRFRR